jgi:hypothetical protein
MTETRLPEKKKGIGDALIGLFVVRDGESGEQGEAESPPPADEAAPPQATASAAKKTTGDPTVDDLIARYASGKTAPPGGGAAAKAAVPLPSPPAALSAAPAAAIVAASADAKAADVPLITLDIQTVLRQGGLSPEEQERVEKALTLLHNLPKETPAEVKRQIVIASLHAFGIPIDQILEAALLQVVAFERHERKGAAETQALVAQSDRRLAELEQEAVRIKHLVSETKSHQQGLAFACSREKLRVKEVLDFFGPEDVERVRQSSVKLRDRQDT